MGTIIQLRNEMKKKKPKFTGQKARVKKTLKDRYRKPKGSDSKMRQKKKGKIKKINTGYKSPKSTRGLHRKGLKVKVVTTLKDVVKEGDIGIIISKRVSMKKKIEILKKTIVDKIKVLNLDPEEYLKKAEIKIKNKKNVKKIITETKTEKTEKEETLDSKLLKETEKSNEKNKKESKID